MALETSARICSSRSSRSTSCLAPSELALDRSEPINDLGRPLNALGLFKELALVFEAAAVSRLGGQLHEARPDCRDPCQGFGVARGELEDAPVEVERAPAARAHEAVLLERRLGAGQEPAHLALVGLPLSQEIQLVLGPRDQGFDPARLAGDVGGGLERFERGGGLIASELGASALEKRLTDLAQASIASSLPGAFASASL